MTGARHGSNDMTDDNERSQTMTRAPVTERRLKRWLLGLAAMVTLGVGLTACGSSATSYAADSTDPRRGWVKVTDGGLGRYGIDKRCDGSTLLYASHDGVAAVPHSDECKP